MLPSNSTADQITFYKACFNMGTQSISYFIKFFFFPIGCFKEFFISFFKFLFKIFFTIFKSILIRGIKQTITFSACRYSKYTLRTYFIIHFRIGYYIYCFQNNLRNYMICGAGGHSTIIADIFDPFHNRVIIGFFDESIKNKEKVVLRGHFDNLRAFSEGHLMALCTL